MDFDIVKSEDLDFFKTEIKKRLEAGCELHGQTETYPSVVDGGAVKSIIYMQALVKRDRRGGK